MKEFLVKSLDCSEFDAMLIIAFASSCTILFVLALLLELRQRKQKEMYYEEGFCKMAFWPLFIPLACAAFEISIITFNEEQDSLLGMFVLFVIIGAVVAKLVCLAILWLAKQMVLFFETFFYKLKCLLHFQGGH